jgi:succinate dehydrogenase flavin-adding protein (antitoxin of CptAB toxin-antitoxin module)
MRWKDAPRRRLTAPRDRPISLPAFLSFDTINRRTMTEEPVEIRRKRLIHRSLYTGMKETDLLLGGFARRELAALDPSGLDMYEALLAEPDPAIYAWATGDVPVPPEHDNDVMARLRRYVESSDR